MGADDKRSAAVLEELALRYGFVRVERPSVDLTDSEREAHRGYVDEVLDSMALFEGFREARDLAELGRLAADHIRSRHADLSDAAVASVAHCMSFDWK